MVRKNTLWYPESTHHITSRGNRKGEIFIQNDDYKVYLSILKEVKKKLPFELYCYCLMTNHVHLQIKTLEDNISSIMKRINQTYAQYFNSKYDLTGHVFQGRYHSEIVSDDAQMLMTNQYIHLNPVRANMVKRPEEYPYSSYGFYIGLRNEREDELLSTGTILSCFNYNIDFYKRYTECSLEENKQRDLEIVKQFRLKGILPEAKRKKI